VRIFNRSTPPIFDAVVDGAGKLTGSWRQWFSGRQTFDNSIQQRWIALYTSGLVVVDDVTLERVSAAEYVPYIFPAGSRVWVRNAGTVIEGNIVSCTYDSGTTTTTWVLDMDNDVALTSVDRIYYGVLTSTVL